MSTTPALANDKFAATLRSTFIAGSDSSFAVTAIPANLPTILTVGWKTMYEAVFRVEGTSGSNSSNYALTGLTFIKGYSENLPEGLAVNCLNHEEYFNQWGTQIEEVQEIAEEAAAVADVVATGWTEYDTITPTRTTSDDPTYVITFAGVDLTDRMWVGMKIKWTQNSTVRYGIITAIAFSTNTTVTIYGGTDYDVDDTSTYAISDFAYSSVQSPKGFPRDPSKWSVQTTSTSNINQAPASQDTWYNVGSLSLVVPIGAWDISYEAILYATKSSSVECIGFSTLSTTTNSETAGEYTCKSGTGGATGALVAQSIATRSNVETLAAKSTRYLNVKTNTPGGVNTLGLRGDHGTTVIRARCVYL